MALLEAIYGGILLSQFVYHRWKDAKAPWPTPDEVMRVPKTEPGTTVPIIMGRCRVDRPVVVWSGNVDSVTDVYNPNAAFYEGDVLYVLGIPFPDGTTLLQGIYVSGQRRENAGEPDDFAPNINAVQAGDNIAQPLPSTRPDFVMITYEFADGNSTQDMATSAASTRMQLTGISSSAIPGYRGYVTLLSRFSINTVEIPAVAFEISTYPTAIYFNGFSGTKVGEEANPADCIAAILCDDFGKLGLGLGTDILDQVSFAKAASKLAAEGHGYSRCWDRGENAREMLAEILEQIDGVLYEDPATGLIVLKLIRPDYDPNSLLHITPANCERLEGLTLTNGDSAPNKILVKYPDRGKEYQENTSEAIDQARAFAGGEREQTLSYPGCHTFALASQLAGRELAARARPLLTCTAIVDRSFWNTRPGDAVLLSWPAHYVNAVTMRVAQINRGGPASNTIRLDLIQDVFYVHRKKVSQTPPVSFPDTVVE